MLLELNYEHAYLYVSALNSTKNTFTMTQKDCHFLLHTLWSIIFCLSVLRYMKFHKTICSTSWMSIKSNMLGCSHLKGQGGPGSSTFYLGQGQKYTLALPLFKAKITHTVLEACPLTLKNITKTLSILICAVLKRTEVLKRELEFRLAYHSETLSHPGNTK